MSSMTRTASSEPGLRSVQPSQSWRWIIWVAWAALAVAFIALAFTARVVPYFPIDLALSLAVQAVPLAWFHTLMVAVSWPGFPPQVYIFVVLVALLFWALHHRREGIYLVAGSVGIAVVSQGVKLLVDRPRPSPSLVHVLIPGLNGGHWSFPAGHTESYVVVFGFIIYVLYTQWRLNLLRGAVIVFGLLMIALIGLSRIDSGEHWFSDVAGGYMLGVLFLTALLAWYRHRGRRQPSS